LILIIEALRGRPLAPESRGIAQFVGLALLILLMIFATFQDISRLSWFS
jgi:regulator of sigma E protease